MNIRGRSSYHENQTVAMNILKREQALAKQKSQIIVSPKTYKSQDEAYNFLDTQEAKLKAYFFLVPFLKRNGETRYICSYKYETKKPKTREEIRQAFFNNTDGMFDDFFKHLENKKNS